jgi:hypothetical protein
MRGGSRLGARVGIASKPAGPGVRPQLSAAPSRPFVREPRPRITYAWASQVPAKNFYHRVARRHTPRQIGRGSVCARVRRPRAFTIRCPRRGSRGRTRSMDNPGHCAPRLGETLADFLADTGPSWKSYGGSPLFTCRAFGLFPIG